MEGNVLTKVSTGLRRLFYAVTPAETSFPTVDKVPKYVDEVSDMKMIYKPLMLINILSTCTISVLI